MDVQHLTNSREMQGGLFQILYKHPDYRKDRIDYLRRQCPCPQVPCL